MANPYELIRVGAGGVVTEFAPLTVNAYPSTIALGPGGDLYYSTGDHEPSFNSNVIGKVVPDASAPPPVLIARYATGSAAESFVGALASFTSADTTASAADFKAVITWRPIDTFNNQPTGGVIGVVTGLVVSKGNGLYTVYGGAPGGLQPNETYAVTVFDTNPALGPAAPAATFSGWVSTVNTPTIYNDGSLTYDNGAVYKAGALDASFTTFADPSVTFTATIDWGDGTPMVSGKVKAALLNPLFGIYGLDVLGSHSYVPGAYVAKVTLYSSISKAQPLAISDQLIVES